MFIELILPSPLIFAVLGIELRAWCVLSMSYTLPDLQYSPAFSLLMEEINSHSFSDVKSLSAVLIRALLGFDNLNIYCGIHNLCIHYWIYQVCI